MSTGWIVLIVVLVILVALIIGLYFLGKRAEKETGRAKRTGGGNRPECDNAYHRQEKVTDQRFRSAEQVIAQTPFYAKLSKLPIVKAKVGPKVMSLICDATIFDEIPVKKEVKARVSGLYITSVRGLHGKTESEDGKKKKRGFVLGHCASRKNSMPANKTYQKGLSDTDKPFFFALFMPVAHGLPAGSLPVYFHRHGDHRPVKICMCGSFP